MYALSVLYWYASLFAGPTGLATAGGYSRPDETKHGGAGVVDGAFVSFVVIAYNESENIARTLDAIAAQDGLGGYEVIVVNDGSTDGTAGIVGRIAAADPRVRLIDLPENRGRGFARSTGTAAA